MGIATSTIADSFGLVTIIIIMAPTAMIMLRKKTEAVAPTADFTCVVSADKREIISPERDLSKNSGDRLIIWEKTSRRRSATTCSPKVITE